MKVGLSTILTGILMTTASKIITALGLGFVTYTGIDYMQQKFANYMLREMSSIPTDAIQIFYIAGGGVVLNWLFGAIAFTATLKTTSHLTASLRK